MLLEFKKKYWRKSKIFNWGFVDRDNWIKEQSKKIKKGSLILDVGAGTGPYRELFAGSDYRTHDLMPHSDDNNRAGQSYTQIDYISDIIELPIEDNIFDVVICTEVIEHVPEPIKALGEIVRVCKPGGLIILSAPRFCEFLLRGLGLGRILS